MNRAASIDMSVDTKKSISGSITRFFSGTLLSRTAGLLRTWVMAFAFGCHPSVAAFFTAFRFAHLLRRLLGEGAMQTAFVPLYEKFRARDRLQAERFFRDLTCSLSLVLLGIILIGELGLYTAFHVFDFSENTRLILYLSGLLLPSLLPICLYGLNSAYLHCEGQFFTSSVAPVLFNLTWAGGVLWMGQYESEDAMVGVSWIVVFACVMQFLMTVPSSWGSVKSFLSEGLHRGISIFSKDVRSLLKPLGLGILGVGAAQINSALDAIFALCADIQGPAYLWYASRIQQVPLALFGTAITASVLPPMARALKANQSEKFLEFLHYALEKSIRFVFPFMGGLFALAYSAVIIVFGQGEFAERDIVQTTLCLWAYACALFPQTGILILSAAFYAKENYYIPAGIAFVSLLSNVILNSLFIFVFDLGTVSVALATSLSALLNVGILLRCCQKRFEGFSLRSEFVHLFWSASVTGLAMAVSVYLGYVYFQDPTLKIFFGRGEGVIGASSFPGEVLHAFVAGLPFIFAWLFLGKKKAP